jgi:hypothetical protein
MNGYYKGKRITQDYISKTKTEAVQRVKKYLKEEYGDDFVPDEADIVIEFTHSYHANNSKDEELETATVTVNGITYNAGLDSQKAMGGALFTNLDEFEWVDADNNLQTISKSTLQEILTQSHLVTTEIIKRYNHIKNNLAPYPQED